MVRTSAFRICLAASLFAALAAPSDARAALAVASGGSGTSGVLSSNHTIRKHQLLCDPNDPASGSYSVGYDPSLVHYDVGSLTSVPGFTVTTAYIELNTGTTSAPKPMLFPIANPPYYYPETGYIQVFFQADPKTDYQPPAPPAGYNQIDAAGVKGEETHGLTFSYLANTPDTAFATYTVFADAGGRLIQDGSGEPPFSTPDFFEDTSGKIIPYNDIAPATVRGNLFVPEPAAPGLLACCAAAGLLRRRGARSAAGGPKASAG